MQSYTVQLQSKDTIALLNHKHSTVLFYDMRELLLQVQRKKHWRQCPLDVVVGSEQLFLNILLNSQRVALQFIF